MQLKPEEIIRKFQKDAAELKLALERKIPIKIAAVSVEHFKENFDKEGFVDKSLTKWEEVKRRQSDKVKGAAKTRRILTGSGNLGRSIQSTIGRGTILIHSDLPYAEVHNEGLRAGKGKGFTMPKRQFIGDSKELEDKIKNIIEQELDKILKP